ncbi:beta-lactamase-like protein [Lyophyllum atratum]|nr:beta-lactamase-like protein [Lyophyllum atratum]
MPSYTDLGIPASTATVDVKVFDLSSPEDKILASLFMLPVLPGHEDLRGPPMYAFLIEHQGKRVMFDLGPRKDPENSAPAISNLVKDKILQVFGEKDITDQLTEAGIPLESIEAVIWSHAHFDHTGDMSKFPPTTELVVGQGTVRDIYPANPNGSLLESDFSGRKVTDLLFDGTTLSFGGLRAVDFFGDGSLYLIDVPGHISGHIAALARVTPTTFLFLGGDTCHHAGQLRPTEQLHRHQPCPGHLVEAARHTISAEYFTPHHEDGTFDLVNRKEPFLGVPDKGKGFYEDPETSRESIRKVGALDANDDVFVMLAHDASLVPVIEKYPAKLNPWKEKGWKEGVWGFVDENNPAFRFNVTQTA